MADAPAALSGGRCWHLLLCRWCCAVCASVSCQGELGSSCNARTFSGTHIVCLLLHEIVRDGVKQPDCLAKSPGQSTLLLGLSVVLSNPGNTVFVAIDPGLICTQAPSHHAEPGVQLARHLRLMLAYCINKCCQLASPVGAQKIRQGLERTTLLAEPAWNAVHCSTPLSRRNIL